jgi:hypothetical protein
LPRQPLAEQAGERRTIDPANQFVEVVSTHRDGSVIERVREDPARSHDPAGANVGPSRCQRVDDFVVDNLLDLMENGSDAADRRDLRGEVARLHDEADPLPGVDLAHPPREEILSFLPRSVKYAHVEVVRGAEQWRRRSSRSSRSVIFATAASTSG